MKKKKSGNRLNGLDRQNGQSPRMASYQDRMIHKGRTRKCPDCGGLKIIGKTLAPGPEGGVWCHCQECGRAFLFRTEKNGKYGKGINERSGYN